MQRNKASTIALKNKKHLPYHLPIKELDKEERPREKLIRQGARRLTNTELLGLLIGSGTPTQSAVGLAQNILKNFEYNLTYLAQASIDELRLFKGIGDAKATTVAAALELGKRLCTQVERKRVQIKCAEDVYQHMEYHLLHRVVEEFWILLMNKANFMIKTIQLSTGGLAKTTVDSGVLFKHCLLNNAVGVILVHNHPSGNLIPSESDMVITQRLAEAAKLLHIEVIDHVIFTDDAYFSFSEQGFMDFS